MFRPTMGASVLARTRDEVDAGLATADQVIVQGDQQLIDYAWERAVAPELASAARPAAKARRGLPWLWAALGVCLAILLAVRVLLPDSAPTPVAASNASSGAGVAAQAAPTSFEPYIWPAVTVVALVLMYLLARKAIAGGSNVKFVWKITDKVGGQLVITKVRTKG